jgi:drug/metabolite transporter (DMT)-like permease
MKSLTTVNVETVIVFRSCSPIAVSIIEYLFLNREFPSFRSCLSLLGVVFGAFLYCLSDSQFLLEGYSSYFWVIIYFVLITTEMTYGKVITSAVKMDSIWGSVLYCSVLSLPLLAMIECYEGKMEQKIDAATNLSSFGWFIILMSSIFATLIGLVRFPFDR